MKLAVALVLAFGLATPAFAEEDDFDTLMMRATVKVTHEKSTGTGFVLVHGQTGGHLLVSAAHVFNNIPGEQASVVFRAKQDDGEYKRVPLTIAIRKDGAPLWKQHPNEDVAVIPITPPNDADVPTISTDRLATDESLKKQRIHPGENVALLGYPHREEANEAGFALLRVGAVASFPLTPTKKSKTLYISINSFEGDSGGPVYVARPSLAAPDQCEPLILGLIHGQRFLDEEARLIYGTTKIRHRLGLAIAVHASMIVETLDLLEKK